MTLMRAALIDSFGPADVIRVGSVPIPEPASNEVLVRVRYAAVNMIDCKTRAGRGVVLDHFPAGLGWDLAGEIVAIGTEVEAFEIGNLVFGMPRFPEPCSCYAQFALAPAASLALCPQADRLPALAAAAMPALTAWQALFSQADSIAGRRVLIHGASGGVGHIAVQLAVLSGARVAATASARNFQFLKELGADAVVDYTRKPLAAQIEDVDVLIDTRGGDDFAALLERVRPGGRAVSLVGQNAAATSAQSRGIRCDFPVVRPDALALRSIADLICDDRLRVEIQNVFPLEGAAEAHAVVEAGHVRGRVLIDPQ